jgi:hypothetical protein
MSLNDHFMGRSVWLFKGEVYEQGFGVAIHNSIINRLF